VTDATGEGHVASGAPADWYPDPTGRHQYRYWNGGAWTGYVADDGLASTDPLADESGGSTGEADPTAAQYSPEVAAILPTLFDATDVTGQMNAARKLGELGDPSAVGPLVEAATASRFDYGPAKEAALEALGILGDPSAAPPVVAAVLASGGGYSGPSASSVGSMLARTADQAALAPLADKAASANEEFDDDYPDWYDPYTSEFFMSTSRETENQLSDACAEVLSHAGPQGVECLLGALGAPRESVGRHLGAVEDPPVDRLVEAAGSAEGNVRAAALLALFVVADRGIERERIEGMLKTALDDGDERVRDEATRSLHWLNMPDEGE
jgi:HEAT repeat protein